MAGDWIKFELSTLEKTEVFEIAEALDIDPDAVVGKLLRVWGWFDQQTTTGNAVSVTKKLLDRKVFVTGFCDAMILVGWLIESGNQITVPNFSRHNGKTAKDRANTAKRVASHRKVTPPKAECNDDSNDKCNADSVTPSLAKEDVDGEKIFTSTTTSSAIRSSKFDIPNDWRPSEHFPAQMLSAGIPEHLLNHETLTEFISFWQTRDSPPVLSQKQWDHKYLQTLINKKTNFGAAHENGSRNPRKQTSHERLMAANAATAEGH